MRDVSVFSCFLNPGNKERSSVPWFVYEYQDIILYQTIEIYKDESIESAHHQQKVICLLDSLLTISKANGFQIKRRGVMHQAMCVREFSNWPVAPGGIALAPDSGDGLPVTRFRGRVFAIFGIKIGGRRGQWLMEINKPQRYLCGGRRKIRLRLYKYYI